MIGLYNYVLIVRNINISEKSIFIGSKGINVHLMYKYWCWVQVLVLGTSTFVCTSTCVLRTLMYVQVLELGTSTCIGYGY